MRPDCRQVAVHGFPGVVSSSAGVLRLPSCILEGAIHDGMACKASSSRELMAGKRCGGYLEV